MDAQIFNDWLNLMSDSKNALKHPIGTSIWLDGLEKIKNLSVETFFRPTDTLTTQECDALNFLREASRNTLIQKNFWVLGHASLIYNSPYYRAINNEASAGKTLYHFVQDDFGEFCPWNNTVTLGRKFYSSLDGQIRIPFYTFNHENTHLYFKDAYSNIQIEDREMHELIILIEWFCISMDLILAYDLIRTGMTYCFEELCRVPSKKSDANIFIKYCLSIGSINSFADKFRSVFLAEKEYAEVYDLISSDTLIKHRSFAQENVLNNSRDIPCAMSPEAARTLILKLKTASLSDLIFDFTGVVYA